MFRRGPAAARRGIHYNPAVPEPYLAVATATSVAKQDFDMPPLLAALAAAGVPARVLAWDDPDAQPGFAGAGGCLIRSTWNYVHHHARFVEWASSVAAATELWNPAEVVRWNSHKRYLLELESRGIPVVPTRLVPRTSGQSLASAMGSWTDVVVKPAVSAGSFGTVRVRGKPDVVVGEQHLRQFVLERDMLVQQYQPSVEDHGERCLIWLDGVFTHAVRKTARFVGDEERVSSEAVPIASDERALAERVLALAPGPLLYARVDLVRDGAARPLLMELELIEPSLFFGQSADSADRLARAIARRLSVV
jgi:glutathione synthase/RimK-type ligase-like ATP-grasp enzyme